MERFVNFFNKFKLAIILTGLCFLFMGMIAFAQPAQNQDKIIRYGDGKGRPGMMGKKMRQPAQDMPLKQAPSQATPPTTTPDDQPKMPNQNIIIDDNPPVCKYKTTEGYQICHPPQCLDSMPAKDGPTPPCGPCSTQNNTTDEYACMAP